MLVGVVGVVGVGMLPISTDFSTHHWLLVLLSVVLVVEVSFSAIFVLTIC